jgi:hypothetical protein
MRVLKMIVKKCVDKYRANGLRQAACKPEVAMLQPKCGTTLRAMTVPSEARLYPPPDRRTSFDTDWPGGIYVSRLEHADLAHAPSPA